MSITSGPVAPGDQITASHFNKIWRDLVLTSGHNHDGEGGNVDHKVLGETANMPGMNHRHLDIEYHLLGGGPGANEIDANGGDRGVHGLIAAAYVTGSVTSQLVMVAGTISGSLQTGYIYFSETGAAPATVYFDAVKSVQLTVVGTNSAARTIERRTIDLVEGRVAYHVHEGTVLGIDFVIVGTKA